MSLIINNKPHKLAMKVNKIIQRQKMLFATVFKTVECNFPLFVNEREDLGSMLKNMVVFYFWSHILGAAPSVSIPPAFFSKM